MGMIERPRHLVEREERHRDSTPAQPEFDDGAVEEQKAILGMIERQRRREREEEERVAAYRRQRQSTMIGRQRPRLERGHWQHKSMPAMPTMYGGSTAEEQMAIMREIERRKRQDTQRRDEEEERRRRQRENQQTRWSNSRTLPANSLFGGTSVEEQRAILQRIEREQQGGAGPPPRHERQRELHPLTLRATKSLPAPSPSQRPSSWECRSPPSSRNEGMADAKNGHRPSSLSSSSRNARGNAAVRRLDLRIKQKSERFDRGSLLAEDSSAPGTSSVARTTSSVPSYASGSMDSRSSYCSSVAASGFDSCRGAAAAADPPSYVSGHHTVVLVDGRDAVARSGGTKKVVTCAGCSKRLTVSRTCEVVFCRRCETLTPAALSDELGAWAEGT
eukprot:CAMPEP_0197439748 /NCGR_PEP_ID=MMETSP1175-20131217/6415_1 /TAXON_ID=1003142 /ORGANISM="Triceratium dubium, Strain CCMP147" /LENGTH=389 /DNA_ID=CAMNT_0042969717 /DNA_START=260 /DNA_END=1429 /DNA_ORIENTATION=-